MVFLTSIESIIPIIVLIILDYFLQVQGIISTLVLPVKDGILSISEAAKRADMSEESFKEYLESQLLSI